MADDRERLARLICDIPERSRKAVESWAYRAADRVLAAGYVHSDTGEGVDVTVTEWANGEEAQRVSLSLTRPAGRGDYLAVADAVIRAVGGGPGGGEQPGDE